MRTRCLTSNRQNGFTLIEMVVFLVVISVGLGALIAVYNQSLINSVDPVVRVKMLEIAQSQLDEITARKYDENTPTGGVPACGSAEPGAQACSFGLDSGENLANAASLDDVDDFHNYSATVSGYTSAVAVTLAGPELGIANGNAKRITVTVTAPTGDALTLSSYRVNF
ncbi:prepilin-type N-terminal cleavage/methylation domain-containing protein [Porticoccus sp. W117]|uniref:prepilin-type N-terminal cleavage/methylation domain-containing protein n=1 Tax=Porticoccus sp. W117 TaxID=3054777 RepID=UPI002598D97D|nr:prepilin-type N-terminal cleavage/methylation domain-containing protein [Porticoccus sp. W117]MDM3870891.1 prepilin-type N-terminal cleavage/methylation domain-containing protein [Porticoccus sp. W117]